MYKMILSDLDETLLVNHHVPKCNQEAIIKARNIKLDEVRKIKEQKKEKKGAFQDRIFLETVEEPEKEQEK